mmetsp:Transcript_11333/g.16888  ORF Transcript_11333/g.16888 Transcript_11333/m.16888 type:complete len:259 (+) Transcript_11333:577-1353(+)
MAALSPASSAIISFLVAKHALEDLPSTVYEANVKGAPTNPIRDVFASSAAVERRVKISRMKGSFSSKSTCSGSDRLDTSSSVRISVLMTGPVPLITSKSMPSVGSGVRISENIIMPSMPYARWHCRLSSTAMSGVSDRSRKGYLFEYSRKAAIYLPACLISHTGVLSTTSPLAARTKISRSPGAEETADAVSSTSATDAWSADIDISEDFVGTKATFEENAVTPGDGAHVASASVKRLTVVNFMGRCVDVFRLPRGSS